MRMFPIMTDDSDISEARAGCALSIVVAMPWPMMTAAEGQAFLNHDQSIERLAERGGLSACEAVAVLEGRSWHPMKSIDAHNRLKDLFNAWWDKQPKGHVAEK